MRTCARAYMHTYVHKSSCFIAITAEKFPVIRDNGGLASLRAFCWDMVTWPRKVGEYTIGDGESY